MATIEALGGGAKLMGQDKWLGGVGSPCGKYIYGVPGHAKDVLRIVVETGEVVNYPPPPLFTFLSSQSLRPRQGLLLGWHAFACPLRTRSKPMPGWQSSY